MPRTPEEVTKVEQEDRRSKAIELRRVAAPWDHIARVLGYASPTHAANDVLAALETRRRETARQLDAFVQLELEKLDALERLILGIMNKTHITVQQGRVVLNPLTGEAVEDYGPKQAGVDRLLKIMERRAKLLGLDSSVKVDVQVSEDTNKKIEELLQQYEGVPAHANPPGRLEIVESTGTTSLPEAPPGTET